MANHKYKRLDVELTKRELSLYVGPKVHAALQELTMDLDLYKGVKLGQVLEAVYEQGMKDGRREIIESLDKIKHEANYLPPGRPRKTRRR